MIEVKNLNKHFKVHKKAPGFFGSLKSLVKREYIEKYALSDFSLNIPAGETIGLIGSNGAGKTTLTKILSGIIHPSSGSVSVLGYNPWDRDNEYRKQMSVIMGQKAQLWWDLPAMDGFLLLKEIYQIPTKEFKESIEYLADYFGIKDELNIQVRRLSLGERMKVELIAALLHRPKVIFLDEPTIGLDITAQKAVRSFLKSYREEFKPTMILTSHYMDDIEELCERIVILRSGHKVFDDSISNLHTHYNQNKVITANTKDIIGNSLDAFPKELGTLNIKDDWLEVISSQDNVMKAANFIMNNVDISDLNIQAEELADVIEKIMNHSDRIE